MTHYTSADVYSDANKEKGFARFVLEEGDTIVNLTSTKEGREIYGPCVVVCEIDPAGTVQGHYPDAGASLRALGAALGAAFEATDKEPDDDGYEWQTWVENQTELDHTVRRHAQALFDMFNHGFFTAQPNPEKIPRAQ